MVRIFVKGGVWRNSEDEILKAAVMKYGLNNWSRVASLLVKKSAKQCKARWYEWLDPSVKKTEWTAAEEEKLLHLAKLFPSQWKTIAPAIGRTAHQCLLHYEELLDMAQEAADGKEPTTQDRSRAGRGIGFLRGRDDPRRLRPGEIDPNPETKPSRADPIDMADEEKEMLQEARARLANTRGRKAKRKAREKQLEEAKRLASLQKRREMKAAGIITGFRRRRRFYEQAEIPFEEKPPPGFYEVPAEENPEGNLNFANVSLQQLEGGIRAREEERLRKEDARKLKRLKTDNIEEYLKLQEKKHLLESRSQRSKLALPEPVLKESELEDLVRLGANAAILGDSSASSLVTPGLSTPGMSSELRTPMSSKRIALEAQNALALLSLTTPLEGEENVDLHDIEAAGVASANARTPNTLAEQIKGSKFTGALTNTPLSAATRLVGGGHTPMTSNFSTDGDDTTAKLSLARLHVKTGFSQLPEPTNEIQIESLPSEGSQDMDLDDEIEQDMEVLTKRKRLQLEEKKRLEFLLSTQVIQKSLPRPVYPPVSALPRYNVDLYIAAAQQQKMQNSGRSETLQEFTEQDKMAARKLLADAADSMDKEAHLLCVYDAYLHPIKGIQVPKPEESLIQVTYPELENARQMLECEVAMLQGAEGLDSQSKLDKLMANLSNSLVVHPRTKEVVSLDQVSNSEKTEIASHLYNVDKKHLSAAIHKIKRLESKYKTLCLGYTTRQEEHKREIENLAASLISTHHQYDCFKAIAEKEELSAVRRQEETRDRLVKERDKHFLLQQHFGALSSMKQRLESLLESQTVNTKA